jgi:hypothetical protein
MRIFRTILACLILSAGLCLNVHASPNIETWDANTSGWQIRDFFGGTEYGSLDWVSSLGGNSGVLRDTGGPGDVNRLDIIYTADPSLAADWSLGGFSVVFDFYSQSDVPAELDIYIQSSSGYAWFLDVTPQLTAGTWSEVSGSLSFGAGWFNIEDGRTTSSQFLADVADMNEIGIMITYADGVGGQVYALDNFDVIPEPETWAFLGIAFLSIGFSFRDRLDRALARARAWITG